MYGHWLEKLQVQAIITHYSDLGINNESLWKTSEYTLNRFCRITSILDRQSSQWIIFANIRIITNCANKLSSSKFPRKAHFKKNYRFFSFLNFKFNCSWKKFRKKFQNDFLPKSWICLIIFWYFLLIFVLFFILFFTLNIFI